jgi:hypothetical protein
MMAMMITKDRKDGNGGHYGAMAMDPIVMQKAILFTI